MKYTAEDVWVDLVERLNERAPDYQTYHDYWLGQQELALDTDELESRFGTTFAAFRDNLARPIIESAESRVRVKEYPSDAATDLWNRLDMPSKQSQVTTEILVKGDGFVIVLPDEDKNAAIWPQVTDAMALTYDFDNPTKKRAALKWWQIDAVRGQSTTSQPWIRLNLYFSDRIERYIAKSAGAEFKDRLEDYERYTDEGKWTTTHSVGEVPVHEFNASYDLEADRGRSDLADATGLIDAVNKTFLDMLTASEYTAAPQRWATGVEIPLDPKTGEPMEAFKAGNHKLWTAPSELAKFGQFAPGELNGYREAVDLLVDHLSFTTRTPSYALMKQVQYPSGPALASAEQPLRQRVGDHQLAFSPVWRDVMADAMKLDGSEVEEGFLEELMPRWLPVNAPFATIELMEELKVLVEVLGVPEEMAWRKAGFTDAEIAEMKQMREEEAVLGEEALAAANVAAILNPEPTAAGLTQDGLIEPETDLTPATGPPQ